PLSFFLSTDTAPTEISPLSLHDALPISMVSANAMVRDPQQLGAVAIRPGQNLYLRDLATIEDGADTSTGYALVNGKRTIYLMVRSEEHTSELQSLTNLVCRLLLEKKKQT